MRSALSTPDERDAPIRTWYSVGGRAERMARPESVEECAALLKEYARAEVRILGDGANLNVDDDGVGDLDISTENLDHVERLPGDALRVGAGVNLPRLVVDCVRDGLAGLEGLGGVPASVGGAAVMNAGGAFGEFAQVVRGVTGLTRAGEVVRLRRDEIDFSYRHSGLEELMVVEVDLALTAGDAGALRARLKDVMAKKKASQPMAERSAGCAFKNPEVGGKRVSAGMLIDRAGCKGMRVGGAEVSPVHANFIVAHEGARARDVIELFAQVAQRVLERERIALEREVVIWSRHAR